MKWEYMYNILGFIIISTRDFKDFLVNYIVIDLLMAESIFGDGVPGC